MPSASIVLLTFNGEAYLAQVLEMLGRQKIRPLEMIAIDSGSTDGTLQILERFSVKLHQIPNSEFSHPGTRNLGARMATGDVVVFLTQDATPADSCWLECLLRPFETDAKIAGSFSRQIPRPGSDLLEATDLLRYFPNKPRTNRLPGNTARLGRQVWGLIQFSNASGAYNRSLLLENPFREDLKMAEDQEWTWRMVKRGYAIAYEPESMALHSHEHTLDQKRERSFGMGESFSRFLRGELGHRSFPLSAWTAHLFLDLIAILRYRAPFSEKVRWLLRSPWHRAVQHYAYYRGWNSEKTQSHRDTEIEEKSERVKVSS